MNNETTLRELVEAYISRQFISGMRGVSADQLRFSVNAIERGTLGPVTLERCTTRFLVDWISKRIKGGISYATAKRDRGNLLSILKYAIAEGWPGPMPTVPQVRLEKRMPTAWTVEEVAKLVNTALSLKGNMRDLPIKRSWWWSSLLLVLYDTGVRVTSALSLKAADVWLDRGAAMLRASTDKTWADRIIRLSPEVVEMFRTGNLGKRELVWPWPWDRRELWRQLGLIQKLAGLPVGRKFGFHCLRRAHATAAVRVAGWTAASRSLGHSSLRMTENYVDASQVAETSQVEVPRPAIKLAAQKPKRKPAKRKAAKPKAAPKGKRKAG